MGVSKHRGILPQKWMVKIMENPMNKWMIWGEKNTYFRKHPYMLLYNMSSDQQFMLLPD